MINHLDIGIASFQYDETGGISHATFEASVEINVTNDLMQALLHVCNNKDITTLKQESLNVFSEWYHNTPGIKLKDSTRYKLASILMAPYLKHLNGNVKSCSLKFLLVPILEICKKD